MMEQREVDHLLEQQTRYYRARAGTYDLDMRWDSDDPVLRGQLMPVDEWFADLPIRGQVLELGCGTGAWTWRLAARSDNVHAIDVAPEMIELAQDRVGEADVTFEVADLYRWQPEDVYDVIFFSFLLTHVPPTLTSQFWRVVASALADDGTVAFVDATPHGHDEEDWSDDGVALRTLRDGSQHRIVKVFPTADQIIDAMADHGIAGTVDLVNDKLLVGVGQRSETLL